MATWGLELRRRFHSRPVILGTLVLWDVAGRTLARILPDLVELDFVAVLVTILLNELGSTFLIGLLFSLPLYAYVVYTLAPRIFPSAVRDVTDARVFRLVTAVSALFVPMWWFGGGFSGVILTGAMVFVILTPLLFPCYVLYVDGRNAVTQEGFLFSMGAAMGQHEDVRYRLRDIPYRWLTGPLVLLVVLESLLLVYIVFAFLGVLVVVAAFIYPITESLILGWVVFSSISRRGPEKDDRVPRWADLEQRVLTTARATTMGTKGVLSVGIVIIGMGFSAVMVLILSHLQISRTTNISQLFVVGMLLVTLGTYSLYGLWYWLRLAARLPTFLEFWYSRKRGSGVSAPGDQARRLPTRPPWYMLPPTLVLASMAAMTHFDPDSGLFILFVGAWAASLLLTVASVWIALAAVPQPALSDSLALPLSVYVQVGGFLLLTTDPVALVGNLAAGDVLGDPAVTRSLLYLSLPGLVYYIPDALSQRLRDGKRRFLGVTFLLVAAAIMAGLWRLTNGWESPAYLAFTVFLCLAAVNSLSHAILTDE